MFADHPGQAEQIDRPERSIRDLAGVLEGVRADADGSLSGTATVTATWLREMLENLQSRGLLDTIGVSINAAAKATTQIVASVRTQVVDAFSAVRSVDWVTEAGAGGAVLLYESASPFQRRYATFLREGYDRRTAAKMARSWVGTDSGADAKTNMEMRFRREGYSPATAKRMAREWAR